MTSRLRLFGKGPCLSGPSVEGPSDGIDRTAGLPSELLQQILGYLDSKSVDQAFLVSRRWSDQCARIMSTRGSRHIRLVFEIVGGETDDGEMDTYWLFRNDSHETLMAILLSLCNQYRLSRLASVERSFDRSFESDVARLLDGESQALMAVQLRISGYLDALNHSERQLTNLVIRPPNVLNAMTDGVITRIATRILSRPNGGDVMNEERRLSQKELRHAIGQAQTHGTQEI